jgi:ABC-2 type transport system permease protein
MNGFSALVKKDLVLYFSNRRSVIVSIVAPILIAAFFGYVFGSGASGPSRIAVGVTDLDQSALSQSIIKDMQGDATFAISELDPISAAAQIKSGKIAVALTLPKDFGASAKRALFGSSDKPNIVLQYDPSQQLALQVVRGLLAQYVMQDVSKALFTSANDVLPDARERIAKNTAMPAERREKLLAMFDSIGVVQNDTQREPDSAGANNAPSRFQLSLP